MTPDTDTGIDLDEVGDVIVPDDLATALRRSAAAVPPGELHPREPRRRHAARQRRRRTAAACLTSAAVLVMAVLVVQAVDRARDVPEVAVADRAAIVDDLDGIDIPAEGRPLEEPDVPVLLPEVHTELQPDGTAEPLPRAEPGDVPTGGAAQLSDGRLVTLATRGPQPGAPAGDVADVLAVFDADGRLLGERNVGRGGEIILAGVRDDQVVLVGGAGEGDCCRVQVRTVDPDTFDESPVAEVERMPDAAAVAGDRLVVVDEPSVAECPVTVVDLSGGGSEEVTALSCMGMQAVTVSPDGALAGVVVQRRAGIPATASAIERHDIVDAAVVFVSLDDGEVQGSYRFDIAAACPAVGDDPCAQPRVPVAYRGLAWLDDDHVELVVQDPAPQPDPDLLDAAKLVPERLRTVLVEVGAA